MSASNLLKTKLISSLLIASTLFAQLSALASDTPTPEVNLLENVIALQGQKLSNDQFQSTLQPLVQNYLAIAPEDGRQDRLEQAMVTLGIYTPAQASELRTETEDAARTVLSDSSLSPSQRNTLLNKEIMQVASVHAGGAEFSACTWAAVGLFGGFGAGAAILDGQNVNSSRAQTGWVVMAVDITLGVFLTYVACSN